MLLLPQILSYVGLAVWASQNSRTLHRLGLQWHQLRQGLVWGLLTGLLLGLLNVSVILWVVPSLDGDINFLRGTPHARLPATVMLPWAIIVIAIGVELNFRGFLLGRLLALCQGSWGSTYRFVSPVLAVGGTSTVFSFDPFMVATFKDLHWIALWDGIIWGTIWVRLRNLYATMAAHAVEVMIVYSILKFTIN